MAPRLSQGTRTPDDPAPRFSFVLYTVADESQPSLTRSTSAVEGRNPQECKHLQPPALATRRTGRRTCIWQCGLTSGPLRHDWPLDAVARETRRRPGRDLLVSTGAGPGHAHPKLTSGVEDYYLAGPESMGRWAGSGAGAPDLSGDVEADALTRLLERKDPRSGRLLPRPPGRAPTVPGLFSVPKSASMLFGLGGQGEQAAVLRAQREAVAAGMRYLETHACLIRRGEGGHIVERGRGLVGAGVRASDEPHGRPADPHARAGREPGPAGGRAVGRVGRASALPRGAGCRPRPRGRPFDERRPHRVRRRSPRAGTGHAVHRWRVDRDR